MFDILTKLTGILPAIVTGLIVILAAIAPLTKSDADNKVLDVLRWIEDKVLSILFPSLKNPGSGPGPK